MIDLITLGDSWVYGVGVNYEPGMTEEQYKANAWDKVICDSKSFRSIICKEMQMNNINLSIGGSSNTKQFRLASEYWLEQNNIDSNVIVLWGLTSIWRTELWCSDRQQWQDINSVEPPLGKILFSKFWDEAQEVKKLFHMMLLWNTWFKSKGIQNYWYNIFNDHVFDSKINNLLFNGNDLLSILVDDFETNSQYHESMWRATDRKIKKALELNLVSPYSLHPTEDTHHKIATIIINELKEKHAA
tara:strand:+ start:1329 stop:2060 length:732 start_codon:yes stop_codon:yes gene_type:complete